MHPTFGSDMSNRSASDLFPSITGQHPRASYNLTHAVGTITQMDTRTFSRSFDSTGRYPTNARVSVDLLLDGSDLSDLV